MSSWLLRQLRHHRPTAVALLDEGGAPWTWRQLAEAVAQHAALRRSQGLGPQQRLALLGPPAWPLLREVLAGWHLGVAVAPLNPRLPPAQRHQRLAQLRPHFLWQGDAPLRLEPMHEAPLNPCPLLDLIFTSGSSGEPKAIAHSLHNHLDAASGSQTLMPLTSAHRYLLSLPLFHIGGLALLMRWLTSGCTLALAQPPLTLAAQVQSSAITHLSLVAAQLQRLLTEMPGRGQLDTLLLGGGPVPAALLQRAMERGWRLLLSYGMTETTALHSASAATPEMGADCVGRPLAGRRLSLSADGEILVGGTTLAAGQWRNERLQPLADARGWYATGDLGRLDDAGHLRILGRRDAQFISGGENIQPEQIERALLIHPLILRALVVPLPHPRWGMRPVAYIAGSPPPLAELRQWLSQYLAPHELPDALLPWPEETSLKPDRQAWANMAAALLIQRDT